MGLLTMLSLNMEPKPHVLLWGLLLLVTLGCAISDIGATPTPLPRPTATPDGNMIHFTAPYATVLTPGTSVPGTGIHYQGLENGVYLFSIDGSPSYKQLNDMILWSGVIAPAVIGDYSLTLTSAGGADLFTEGSVYLSVLNPAPLEIPITSLPPPPADFTNMPVAYYVPVGRRVPGTTLTYIGQQNGAALFSGSGTHTSYLPDNSLTWSGRLTDKVLLRYDLVVDSVSDDELALSGFGHLWFLK